MRTCDSASPTLTYARDRVVAELQALYALRAHGESGATSLMAPPGSDQALVVLCRLDRSPDLQQWCRQQGLDLVKPPPLPAQGYHIVCRAKPARVVIAADSDVGVWYGACAWLDSLQEKDGRVLMPVGIASDGPALAIRFSRGMGSGAPGTRWQQAMTSLDWWARWRMNVAHTDGFSGKALQDYLAEAHKRGIRVVRGLGVRNLCAADDAALAARVEEVRNFLQLGGDGVSMLWDDLPHDRCRGHCERCRARFGTNSLPYEIVHILEAICSAAGPASAKPLVLWCPPHYSESRYPEMPDETFFRVIGASEPVRRQTHMYFCEFAPEKTLLLDQLGITNRVWWYNGLRTVYHVSHHWPTEPGMKLSLPGVRSLDGPDFARFEVGWKTGIGVCDDGNVLPVPAKTWQDLQTLPSRYQGYYPCTAGHPYHAAISGLYAFSPAHFDQAQADRVVFRAIFGPGSAVPARAWSDTYVGLQIWLSQSVQSNATQPRTAEAQRRIEQWRAYARQVQACASADRTLLPQPMVQSALARMTEAENRIERILHDWTTGALISQPQAKVDAEH